MNKSLIPEGKRQALCDLIEKTDANIRQIQVVGDVFVSPVLNQWRCATVHAVRLLCSGINESDLNGLLEHMKKAYRDSCEILLDIHLENAYKFLHRFRRVHKAGTQKDAFIECYRVFSDGLGCRRRLAEGLIGGDADRVNAIEVEIQKLARNDEKMRTLLPELDYRYREDRRMMMLRIAVGVVSVLAAVFTAFVLKR